MNHVMLLMFAVAFTTATAAKVLAVMASVFAIIQGIKKAFPALGGWGAIILNVALAVVGAVVVIPPDQFFSLQTVTTLALALIAALGAAGIHGTVKSMSAPSS